MEPTQNNQELSIEDAKAALGNATFLQDQLLGEMGAQEAAQQGTLPQEEAKPSTEKPVQEDNSEIESLRAELDELKEEVKKQSPTDELADIRRELQELLNEEEGED